MDLLPRLDMALSLGFHILFASVGMTMPVLMVLAERRWQRTREPEALALAKAWAQGTAILFAVGAVSGTVLAFELGLLFPKFMERMSPAIGLAFALEGVAFFTEAVFLGLYLYGWDRLKPKVHLFTGVVVALSGFLSAAFVTLANAWMHTPVGFRLQDEKLVDIHPWKALLSPAAFHEVPHGVLASYAAVATLVAAIHAAGLLRDPRSRFHRLALGFALTVAVPANLIQPLLGHYAGGEVARWQPVKFAALEAHFETEAGAPLLIGGFPDYDAGVTRFAIRIPKLLSFLAWNDFNATVTGLKAFPKDLWPPVLARYCFQFMILCGVLLALVYLRVAWRWGRTRSLPTDRLSLKTLLWVGPLGAVALETGWIATEVGRQPWIVQGLMRTREAINDRAHLLGSLVLFATLYLILGTVVLRILIHYTRRGSKAWETDHVAR